MTAKVRLNWFQVKFNCQRAHELNPDYFAGDSIAKREDLLDYTDHLSRSGLITQANRDNWSCPW